MGGVEACGDSSEGAVVAADGALVLVGHQYLTAEGGGAATALGADRGGRSLGGLQVEAGETADVRVERRLEVRVE
jgi:hypothetical protein